MLKKRKRLQLSLAEDQLLRQLYLGLGFPIDQYDRRKGALGRLTGLLNAATDRDDAPEDVMHYMRTRRKQGKWVTFDGQHRRLQSMPDDLFTSEEWAVFDELYLTSAVAADNYSVEASLREDFARRLSQRIGRAVLADVITPAMIDRRKRGNLPKLGNGPADRLGFADINKVS